MVFFESGIIEEMSDGLSTLLISLNKKIHKKEQ